MNSKQEVTNNVRKQGISSKVKQIVPILEKQVDFSKKNKLLVTAFRKNPEKQMTNYRIFWQYLVGMDWKFKWRAPNLASVIIVQDQSSAAQALRYKNTIVNNIGMGGQSCYGGTKGAQLRCRMEIAARDGCSYDDLKIQPTQYRFWIEEECTAFFDSVCDTVSANGTRTINEQRLWIEKPSAGQHGVGMKVHKGCEDMKKRWGSCNRRNEVKKKWFVMEYIDPALLEGHKFDLRTFLLVASLDPLLVFYHNGFVRRAGTPYDSDLTDTKAHITNAHSQDNVDDHFWGFERLETYLHEKLGFPEDYMRENFKTHAIKIENFVFQAARANMFKRKGTFQLFALDWIIDSTGGIHMLEANSNPLVTNYPIPGYPETWNTMMDLVLKIQSAPEELNGALTTIPKDKSFKYENWELVFSEDEELALGLTYNTCESLKDLNTAPFAEDLIDEDALIEKIQKKLNIEEKHLHELAALEDEFDAETVKVITPEAIKSDEEEEKIVVDPVVYLKEITNKNSKNKNSFLENFSCDKIIDETTITEYNWRCRFGENTHFESYFYVFDDFIGKEDEDVPTVLVVSGVHGNEPAGVVA